MFDPELAKKLQKPERRSAVKKKAKAKKKLSRRQCREIVYRREKWKCQRCKREVTLDCWPWEDRRAHVNEFVPRSRGGDGSTQVSFGTAGNLHEIDPKKHRDEAARLRAAAKKTH